MTANLDANDAIVRSTIKEAYERLTRLTDGRGIIEAAGSACGGTCSALRWCGGEELRLKWGEAGSARSVELSIHDHPLPLPSSNNSTLRLIEVTTDTTDVAYDAGNRLTTSTKVVLQLLGVVDDENGDKIVVMRTDDHAVETMSPDRQRNREFGGKSQDYTLSTLDQLEAVLGDAHDLLTAAIG